MVEPRREQAADAYRDVGGRAASGTSGREKSRAFGELSGSTELTEDRADGLIQSFLKFYWAPQISPVTAIPLCRVMNPDCRVNNIPLETGCEISVAKPKTVAQARIKDRRAVDGAFIQRVKEAASGIAQGANDGRATERYPFNPNGSAGGITGFTNTDGRVTIMMPHPERVFLRKQFSWLPADWNNEYSPWMQLFINARQWLDAV